MTAPARIHAVSGATGIACIQARAADLHAIGLLPEWPQDEADNLIRLVLPDLETATDAVRRINTRLGAHAGHSIAVRFGRLTPAQYRIVAKIDTGADVRAWDPDINRTALLALIRKRIVECQPATCRLTLRG